METLSLLGRILEIDLSVGTQKFLPFPDDLVWKHLGGRGFNVQFLYANLPFDTDPLGPENILMFSCGLLTGTAAPTSRAICSGDSGCAFASAAATVADDSCASTVLPPGSTDAAPAAAPLPRNVRRLICGLPSSDFFVIGWSLRFVWLLSLKR